MPLYRCSLTMQDVTMLPRDQYENTIYVQSDVVAHPTPEQCLTIDEAMQGLYGAAVATYVSPQIVTAHHWTRFYDMGDAKPRVPFYEHEWSNLTVGSGTTALPSEIACVLSMQGAPQPLPVRPQSTRGRLFIGPLSTSAVGTTSGGSADSPIHSRPHSAFMAQLMAAGQNLATVIAAIPSYRWVIYSPKWGHTTPVLSVSVDNSWDIMHSRGDRPTTRIKHDVDHGAGGWMDIGDLVHP